MDIKPYSQAFLSNGNGNGNGKHIESLPPIYQAKVAQAEEELNLKELLTVVKRRAAVITGVAIAVTSGACLWTWSQEKQYQSNFQLLVEPVTAEKNVSQLFQVAGINSELGAKATLDYDTQIKVLRSPKVLDPIIENLNEKYPEIDYQSLNKQLKISRIDNTKILEFTFRDSNPDKVDFVLKKLAKSYLSHNQNQRQSTLVQKIRFVEGNLQNLQQKVNQLQEQLLKFRQQYQVYLPDAEYQVLATRKGKLEQDRDENLVKLSETNTLYNSLQKQVGLPVEQATAAVALTEAKRYQGAINKYADLQNEIAINLTKFREESPTIQTLREQQRNLLPLINQEAENALQKPISGTQVPIVSIDSMRLDKTKQMLDTANQLQTMQVRQFGLNQIKENLNKQSQLLAVLSRNYTNLQQELTLTNESFNRYLGVRETLQIELNQNESPWQMLLAPKRPEQPVSPDNQRNIMLGGLCGLLLGMGSALLIERLNNVFYSPNELSDKTKLPLLGAIPYEKQILASAAIKFASHQNGNGFNQSEKELEIGSSRSRSRYDSSAFLEAFRSLYTNINFLASEQANQSLVISSTIPGEGKSSICINLAKAAAAMGQRVLLVDADMRRPTIHRKLGISNDLGLSNLIVSDVPAKDVIQTLYMWNNLHVLTAGEQPPNPTQLLSSHKMRDLIDQFQNEFDLVIYDTPPILQLADGRILAAHTDGIIMVVGLGKTDRSLLKQALESLQMFSASVLGVIANGVKGQALNTDSYYQSYYKPESESEIDINKAIKFFQKK